MLLMVGGLLHHISETTFQKVNKNENYNNDGRARKKTKVVNSMWNKIKELEKRVEELEEVTMGQRIILTEIINLFNTLLRRDEIDIEKIKKMDIRNLRKKR